MSICALTMVYKDYWALGLWYRHYSNLFGSQNLFIVVHGPDEKVADLCPGANILHIPRDNLSKFDKRRSILLNGFAAGLREVYRWVVRTDVDELVCIDPDIHTSVHSALKQSGQIAPAVFALGLNLTEMPDDPAYDDTRPLGAQRHSVWFSGHYSKAIATNGPADLWRHGVKVLDRPFREFAFEMPEGLYLVHLKFANLAETAKSDTVRRDVATPKPGQEDGLPGDAWLHAEEDTEKLLKAHYARRQTSWHLCETEAYVEISQNPRRFRRIDLIKARSLHFDTRADIPDWLAAQLAH